MTSFSITDIINIPLGYVLELLYRLTSNYGISIILFSVFVSLSLFPMRMKNSIGSAKKEKLRPMVAAIRSAYPNNIKAQNYIMGKLYEKEDVSPSMGCLTFVLPLFILLPLYSVITRPIIYMLHESEETAYAICRIIFPDGFNGYAEMAAAQSMSKYAEQISAALPSLSQKTLSGIDFNAFGLNLSQIPQLDASLWDAYDWSHVGLVLLPCLAALMHIVPGIVKESIRMIKKLKAKRDGTYVAPDKKASFDYITPMLTLLFTTACFQVPGALSLYWLTQSIMSEILNAIIHKKVSNLSAPNTELKELFQEYELSLTREGVK